MGIQEKTNRLAQDIKNCVIKYNKLVGYTFLVVYENNYRELMFKDSNFKHLTGAGARLSADEFFINAMNGTLMGKQLFFEAKHPYTTCKNKIRCLNNIDSFLKNDNILVENITTENGMFFKIGITNLDFTICFSDNKNKEGKIIDSLLIPYSIRIKDDSFNKSNNQFFIDFIFKKKNNEKTYNTIVYGNKDNIGILPENIKGLIEI